MLRLKESIRLYFSDSDEKRNADFVLRLLFGYFPGSEVRLKTSKCTASFLLDDMEEFEPEPIEIPNVPSHAEKVMRYFAEKEKAADEIFKEAANELKKLGKDELIKRLKTAVTFYQSGDWIDDDNLARKNEH